ncbi:MAG TPA: VCBS repeat-containing protein, partial [Candidatus Acidoferrum sp.]|nr:VCBS repeat-containing protein [Candidatus Acidoferrum sp.]
VADVNKDGKVDLIISNTNFPTGNHPVRRHSANNTFNPVVLLGNGDGTFTSAGTISTDVLGPLPMMVADFNGDGNPDVAMAECCGLALLNIAFGNGDGTFQESQAMQVSTSPADVQVADLNGDGLPDIVTGTSIGGGGVTVLINQYSMSSGGGGTPDFTLAANPTTLTTSGSGSATTTITVTPANGFNGTVSFTCSGLPANTTCGFSPTTVTPSGGAASTTLTITTGVQSAMLHRPTTRGGQLLLSAGAHQKAQPVQRSSRMLFGFGFGGMFLLIVLGAGAKACGVANTKHLTRYLLCCTMLTMVLFWMACGGNGNSSSNNGSGGNGTGGTGTGNNNTAAGTYTITVTATSGSLNHSTTVTLTVQ